MLNNKIPIVIGENMVMIVSQEEQPRGTMSLFIPHRHDTTTY